MVVIDLLPADEAREARTARRRRLGARVTAALVASVVLGGHVVLEHASAATHREATIVDARTSTCCVGRRRRCAGCVQRQAQLATPSGGDRGLEARGRPRWRRSPSCPGAVPPGSGSPS